MERIEGESLSMRGPALADVFVGGETLQGLQSAGEVVGGDEVAEMEPELLVVIVVEAVNGSFLDGPVHALDLPLVQECLGFVRRWSMSCLAQANSKAWA